MTEQRRRRTRANGEQSRRRILDAATEVASERGYEGTSIALVSKKCGLPASSIYWHFADKDDLIAAVIERSFGAWLGAWVLPEGDDLRDRIAWMAMQLAKALQDSPDFLRLGLMLSLERRSVEPRARGMFLEIRQQAYDQVVRSAGELLPTLSAASTHKVATYAIAAADGLFIAKEIDGDSVDLTEMFRLHAQVIYDTAMRLVAEDGR